jgi:hypothetical protein
MIHTKICRVSQSSHEICKHIISALTALFPVDYHFYKKLNASIGDYEVWVKSATEVPDITLAVMRGEQDYK